MYCKCKSGLQKHQNKCKRPPKNICETDKNTCPKSTICVKNLNDPFSYSCEHPCDIKSCPENEICFLDSGSDAEEAECRCEEGYRRRIKNDQTSICEMTPENICVDKECGFPYLKCYENTDASSNTYWDCLNPCQKENLCQGQANTFCVYENGSGHKCKCENGFTKRNGICTKIPLESPCKDMKCKNPDHSCFEDPRDPKFLPGICPCDEKNCRPDQKCYYDSKNEKAFCKCPANQEDRNGQCVTVGVRTYVIVTVLTLLIIFTILIIWRLKFSKNSSRTYHVNEKGVVVCVDFWYMELFCVVSENNFSFLRAFQRAIIFCFGPE